MVHTVLCAIRLESGCVLHARPQSSCIQPPIAGLSVLRVTKEEDKKKKSEFQIWRRRKKRALGVGHHMPPPPPQGVLVRGHAGLVMNKLSMS